VTKKVGILDYGVGNLKSVYNAVRKIGCQPMFVKTGSELSQFKVCILPGVGNFGFVVKKFRIAGLEGPVKDFIASGGHVIGICVGMQMLFEGSEESPDVPGLGVFEGKVRKLSVPVSSIDRVKLPHIEWQELKITNPNLNNQNLFDGVSEQADFYFVHSYTVVPNDSEIVVATAEYCGDEFVAMIGCGTVMGTQFHPERSRENGLTLLKNAIGTSI
jgi:imidazole glycerol phosphate synthase glutamine amidotransferase subunit